jgi:flagellar biosynthesis protein FlhA
MARTVTRQYVDPENKLYCITLEPSLERDLAEKLTNTSFGAALILDPNAQQHLVDGLQFAADQAMAQGYQAVLLCGTQLRLPLRRLLERYMPSLHVLAYSEVASRAEVEFVGQVRVA